MKTKITLILFGVLIAINASGQREKEYKSTVQEIRQLLQDTVHLADNLDLIKKRLARIEQLERYYSDHLNFNKKGMSEIKEESKKQIKSYNLHKAANDSIAYRLKYLEFINFLIANNFNEANNNYPSYSLYIEWKVIQGASVNTANMKSVEERGRITKLYKLSYAFYTDKKQFLKAIQERNQGNAWQILEKLNKYKLAWDNSCSIQNSFMGTSLTACNNRYDFIRCENKISELNELSKRIRNYDSEANIPDLTQLDCDTKTIDEDIEKINSALRDLRNIETEVKKRKNIPPIEFTEAFITFDYIGTPLLNLRVKNISNNTVDAFEAKIACFTRFGDPVKNPFYKSNQGIILNQETIEPDGTSGFSTTYALYFQEETGEIKIVLTRVHLKDDTVWKPNPEQEITIEANIPN